MLLIALAIAPGIAISLFIYSQRAYRGALLYLILSFVLGMAATLPALALQLLAGDVRDDPTRHSLLAYAWYAFIVVGLSEEGVKFLVLRLYAFRQAAFRQPFDGILFAVLIGMGFATVENIEYVYQLGSGVGWSRAFLSVPAHGAFAVLMGYNVGWAKAVPERSVFYMIRGLGIAVLFHGSFDFFIFLQQGHVAKGYVSDGLLSFGAFATFYIAVRMAMNAIRMHRKRNFDEEK
ncbi:MAG: PrsW family glutamic-type intramembrane protease [Bacteroidota bacterium]|nr:PrsW family glutamic-type intramembrane protease [Bacteroidota bacterium]MDP4246618.1 PrsW family glutamic-type intramembrane protease [Bacteroidota bacterium]MDP4255377.1 PrsW family glutamic-type intramembrane protease [Bacteroidota bacterium]MDP4258853.1 PrsW family glutamic-type intramembrane protease [Bacteroidota bacterium]